MYVRARYDPSYCWHAVSDFVSLGRFARCRRRLCIHACSMSKDAEQQPPPVPSFAKEKGPAKDVLKGIPHLDDDVTDEEAVSHKCDVAGCHTYGHLEYYRRTYENNLRS